MNEKSLKLTNIHELIVILYSTKPITKDFNSQIQEHETQTTNLH